MDTPGLPLEDVAGPQTRLGDAADLPIPSAEGAPAPEDGKYVYCIIKSDTERDFGPIGIGEGGRVYTVHFGGVAAVVSDTPIRIYDPTRENVLAHQMVNETVMRDFTVIPMSFGTIFRTK